MIEFYCSRRDKTKTPIIRNKDIWDYAESVVGDYKPNLLKEPGKVNGLHFVESYLGATVDYQDIYYPEGSLSIAGATVFNNDRIKVFDREHQCISSINVSANTIILDNSTVEDGKDGYANFTVLHEGGHLTMHQKVYKRDESQISIFEPNTEGQSVVCCRKLNIIKVSKNHIKSYTPEEIREHQANVFAAFVAMPRRTFIPYAKEMIKDAGFEDGVYIYYDSNWESAYYLKRITNKLAETYGVTKSAAEIHLKELELLFSEKEFKKGQAQTHVDALSGL